MDGSRKIVAVFAFMAVILAVAAPAMAQSYGSASQSVDSGYAQSASQGTQTVGQNIQQGQADQTQADQGRQSQQGGLKETNKDLMQTIDDTQDVSMFAAAVKAAGYDQTLGQKEGPYMVFAPSDSAMQNAGITDINSMDQKSLKSLVEGCIVSKVTEPKQGSDTIKMTSMSGEPINAKKTSGGITVNGIKVSSVMKADNGILGVTDGIVATK